MLKINMEYGFYINILEFKERSSLSLQDSFQSFYINILEFKVDLG